MDPIGQTISVIHPHLEGESEQADFVENTNNAVTAARVAAHEEAAIGKHRQGTASTDENKQYDPGGTSDDPLISA